MVSLSVSCVSFASDKKLILDTISSLAAACEFAKDKLLLNRTELFLIDNGPNEKNLRVLKDIEKQLSGEFDSFEIISGQGNVGYGAGNNLSLNLSNCDFHLILNPDVIICIDAIQLAVEYMVANPKVGLLAPDVFGDDGGRQYLARRTPEVTLLGARALNCNRINLHLNNRLRRYEYRDKIPASKPILIELASGCFMFCKMDALKKARGFDTKFFMYFEDYDLCRRMWKFCEVHHVPSVKIVHSGGGAARKGWRHIIYFISSMYKFMASK